MVTRVLATTHEVSLKGGNRSWFEGKLVANIRTALSDLPLESITRPQSRVLVSFSAPAPFPEVARRLAAVFGLHAIMPVTPVGVTIDEVKQNIPAELEGLSPASFAVRVIRSDKAFPLTSLEVEREVGTVITEATHWPVNLRDPDLTVRILIDGGGCWLYLRRVPGPGGLPTGVGGRATCLLSGGIDSPVAAYMMMKRGMRLDFVHFHSVPRSDPASLDKARDLVAVAARYQGNARLALVPLLPIQEEIVAKCPPELRVLLYRRFMLRIAEQFAGRWRSHALVTGESLGQVASQTIENLRAVESVVRRPVLRPLIGLDKQQIIAIARRVGTYDLSIMPHFDCCSFLMPAHPTTKSNSGELDEAETALDVRELVATARKATEIERIKEPVPWEDIPVPPKAED
ncbi:MAG: tRNA 4-thiouridine(8) synthase ThiI [bacterium]|nr:tRNA 4-thiouridine(8) synthase ThiI [bacterium]